MGAYSRSSLLIKDSPGKKHLPELEFSKESDQEISKGYETLLVEKFELQ